MKFLRKLDNDGAAGGFASTVDENFNFRMDTTYLGKKLDEIIQHGEEFQTALSTLGSYFSGEGNLWQGADAAQLASDAPLAIKEMDKRKQEIDNLCKVARELRRVIDQGQGDLQANIKTALGKTNGGGQ